MVETWQNETQCYLKEKKPSTLDTASSKGAGHGTETGRGVMTSHDGGHDTDGETNGRTTPTAASNGTASGALREDHLHEQKNRL